MVRGAKSKVFGFYLFIHLLCCSCRVKNSIFFCFVHIILLLSIQRIPSQVFLNGMMTMMEVLKEMCESEREKARCLVHSISELVMA